MTDKNENTIFRKVYCKDRLPEDEGVYFTYLGLESFDGDFKQFYGVYPEYWYEEVELPSEEEIEQLTKIALKDVGNTLSVFSGFKTGFNAAIELIKGGSK